MKSRIIQYCLMLVLLIPTHFARAQHAKIHFSLKESVQYGVGHHLSIQKSDYELEKYNQKFREELSSYLPQIKADASYTKNLKLMTQIIPGEFMGNPGQDVAVQFGTKYNASANIDVSQTLIDFEKLTGQQIARQNSRIGILNKQKTVEQVIYDISNAYTISQVAFLQQDDISSNIQKIDSLITGVQSQVENGFAKHVDLKRLQLERMNLQTQLQNAKLQYDQSLTILKYAMIYPLEEIISIDTKADHSTLSYLIQGDLQLNSTDLQLLSAQDKLTTLSLKQVKQSYLPKLSFNFKYGTLAQQNTPDVFNRSANWYPNSLASINLSIPIFDGNYRLSNVRQLQLEDHQNKLDISIRQNELNKDVKNTREKLITSVANLATTKESKVLADDVYALSYTQFQNGYTSLKELLDANTEVKGSQTAYLKAILEVQSAELELLKVSGNIQLILK